MFKHLYILLWSKGSDGPSRRMAARRDALIDILGRNLPKAEGRKDGPLEFSTPVPERWHQTYARRTT